MNTSGVRPWAYTFRNRNAPETTVKDLSIKHKKFKTDAFSRRIWCERQCESNKGGRTLLLLLYKSQTVIQESE